MENSTLNKDRDIAISSICTNLSLLGWSEKLIYEVEKENNWPKNYIKLLFPDGKKEIAECIELSYDNLLSEEFDKIILQEKSITKRIERLVKARIIDLCDQNLILHQDALFAIPTNIILSQKISAKTCDLIWSLAGDHSTDFNFYSKRALLFPIYKAARKYYIGDDSDNKINTSNFISSSLKNIVKFMSTINKLC